ncbi:hypothetical protein T4E_1182, partial [Trichinella pseudospiralis]
MGGQLSFLSSKSTARTSADLGNSCTTLAESKAERTTVERS